MNIMELIKEFRADLIKVSIFIFSFGFSLVYVMTATKINIRELLDYFFRNIKF